MTQILHFSKKYQILSFLTKSKMSC